MVRFLDDNEHHKEAVGTSVHKSLNLQLDVLDLAGKFLVLVRGNAGSNDRPRHPARTPQCCFGRNEDVRNILSHYLL